MENDSQAPGRREFLRTLGGSALGLALAGTGYSAGTKPMRGVFPIGQTPVTESDQLDLECLQNEVKFCNRYKVHGFAWPQIASGWTTLSEKERRDGVEAILAAGKGGQAALVIGVQDKEGNLDKSIAYAKHAARNGADAIVSLPPEKADDKGMIEYYKTIGQATDLPLFVQSRGDMSVDLIVEMARQIPTMKCVKDEAGNPLARVTQIRERTNDKLAVFSGNGVRTMIDEMRLGFSGHCPTTVLSDFYAAAFDLWHAGKRAEAFDMFGRIQAFNSITGAGGYLMVMRGVFKESTKTRAMSMGGSGAAGRSGGERPAAGPLDEATKQAVRDAWDEFMKPYLRG
ncbi:MAG: dihydrodipicolinate synthase family protein [Bryobacteraceae bacterium]|jgi:dihydrodipicolinate synthase/N-acetylneuraminate lyase